MTHYILRQRYVDQAAPLSFISSGKATIHFVLLWKWIGGKNQVPLDPPRAYICICKNPPCLNKNNLSESALTPELQYLTSHYHVIKSDNIVDAFVFTLCGKTYWKWGMLASMDTSKKINALCNKTFIKTATSLCSLFLLYLLFVCTSSPVNPVCTWAAF